MGEGAGPGLTLATNRAPDGRGFTLVTGPDGAVELILGDGRVESRWPSERGALAVLADRACAI